MALTTAGRGTAATVAVLVLGALLAPGAAAEVPGSLSDVRVSDDRLTATLVLRSGGEALAVDAGSVTATVGGQPAQSSVEPAEQITRSTMLVIDTSGSMGATGMATVRTAVKDFLAVVPEDVRVGVVSFATTSGVDVAPTTDHAKVSRSVGSLRSGGETSLYKAVQDAVRGLGTDGERSIVLLSDGGDTVAALTGGDAEAKSQRARAAAALRRAKVRAEVVSFQSAEADTSVLQQFADAGGGSVAKAGNRDAVSAAFQAAARTLDSQALVTVTRPGGVSGSQPVVVAGTAGGQPFQVTTTVDLGDTAPPVVEAAATDDGTDEAVAAPAAASTLPLPGSALNLPLLLVAVTVTFIGVLVLGLALGAPTLQSTRSRRVEAVEAYGYGTSRSQLHHQQQTPSVAAISQQLVQMGDKVMEGRESTTKTMTLLTRADLPWRAGEWLVLRMLVALVLPAVGAFVWADHRVIGGVIGLVLGVLMPPLVLRLLASRRANKFERILPDVLTLVATSLSSGFSLPQALDSVAKDAPEPAAKEFSRALAQSRIGTDMSDSLDDLAARMDSPNMRWTTMAIRIQREVGGNLAETLRTTAATLREREMLRRQVKALSAEGRLSAYILVALPIGVFFYSMMVNYDYISLLWTEPLGRFMLAGGIISLGIGIAWMRNVVKIEV